MFSAAPLGLILPGILCALHEVSPERAAENISLAEAARLTGYNYRVPRSGLFAVRQRPAGKLEGERIVLDHRGPVEIQHEMGGLVSVREALVDGAREFSGEILQHGGNRGGILDAVEVAEDHRVHLAEEAVLVQRLQERSQDRSLASDALDEDDPACGIHEAADRVP